MRMSEIRFGSQPPVDGYGPGGFRIAGDWHAGSVVVDADGVTVYETITDSSFDPFFDGEAPDVVLVGQGPEIAPLGRALRERFEAAGIGFEVMGTAAACRTYNVLLAEGRRVAAVLKAI